MNSGFNRIDDRMSKPLKIVPEPQVEDASWPGIIGSSPPMLEVYRLTRQVARCRASVMLLGETGTGKELIAQAVHSHSERKQRPFVRVNCGALSDNLLESELFGHVRGAFTGAHENRIGRFEAAHTGTIFLDEINCMTHQLQVKLLRVLQEREFERVGSGSPIKVDVRIVATTNRSFLHRHWISNNNWNGMTRRSDQSKKKCRTRGLKSMPCSGNGNRNWSRPLLNPRLAKKK